MWVRSLYLVVVALTAAVGYLAYSQWQFDQLSQGLDADIATLHRLRWERPPLRPPTVDGNAAEAVHEALQSQTALEAPAREAIAEALHFGQPIPKAQLATLDSWKAAVERLRMATHHSWSATTLDLARTPAPPVPDYPLIMDAALVMLADAARQGGDGCLSTVADTIRMGQDLVAGAPLEASGVAMRIASLGARVVGYCTPDASGTGLRRASAEFRLLATEGPPTGAGIEVADLLATVKLRRAAAIDRDAGYGEMAERLRARGRLFAAWRTLAHPSRWRQVLPEAYPDAVTNWRGEQDWRAGSEHQGISEGTAGVLEWLYDDQRGQATLRALALGMATLAERERRGKTPRSLVGVRDAALRDPYTGSEMRFRLAQDGSELTVWSVGEDMRDDRGTDEWAADAPLDVTVHLRLSARAAGRTKRGKHKGRRGR